MCPDDSPDYPKLATEDEVIQYLEIAKVVITMDQGKWAIVRLANNVTISGEGYRWHIIQNDQRPIRPSLCFCDRAGL